MAVLPIAFSSVYLVECSGHVNACLKTLYASLHFIFSITYTEIKCVQVALLAQRVPLIRLDITITQLYNKQD